MQTLSAFTPKMLRIFSTQSESIFYEHLHSATADESVFMINATKMLLQPTSLPTDISPSDSLPIRNVSGVRFYVSRIALSMRIFSAQSVNKHLAQCLYFFHTVQDAHIQSIWSIMFPLQ